jgi:holin-like protein
LIAACCLLLSCQLAGEVAARLAGLPIPGPVLGMLLLFALLMMRGLSDELDHVAGVLLDNLSLLFVPAAAGVVQNLSRLQADWLPILAAVIGSTLLATGAAGIVAALLGEPEGNGE